MIIVLAAIAAIHPDSAISCRLQVFRPGQQAVDPRGAFAPFVLRFNEGTPPAMDGASVRIAVYDPQNLLKGAKPLTTYLGPQVVYLNTSFSGGAAGVMQFVATDAPDPHDRSEPVRPLAGKWKATIRLTDGPGPYEADGDCRYTRGDALVEDEALVVRAER